MQWFAAKFATCAVQSLTGNSSAATQISKIGFKILNFHVLTSNVSNSKISSSMAAYLLVHLRYVVVGFSMANKMHGTMNLFDLGLANL